MHFNHGAIAEMNTGRLAFPKRGADNMFGVEKVCVVVVDVGNLNKSHDAMVRRSPLVQKSRRHTTRHVALCALRWPATSEAAAAQFKAADSRS